MKTSGVYKIVHRESAKLYVGSAINIKHRWGEHRRLLRRNRHHSALLQRAWNKYGPEAFEFVVIEEVNDLAILLEREDHWISALDAANPGCGYNICKKAGSCLGIKHSEDTKRRLSAARKGKKKSPEHQMAINKALTGRKLSEETRKKISAARRGRSATEEARRRMREGHARTILSEESRRRIVTANVGVKFSEEHRKKIADAIRGRTHSSETRAKISAAKTAFYLRKKINEREKE